MVKARTAWVRIATALMFALWLAVGCTDSNAGEQGVGGAGGDAGAGGTGGNGVEGSSIGPVLGGVNEVTEAVIAENRLLLDGLRFAASYVARTLADAPMTAAATTRQKGGDGPPCILGGIDGMQFIYNEATGAYETSGDGTGPGGTVRFSVYEIVDDAPDTESLIGSLVLSCLGDSAAAHLTANLQVGGVVIVRAEGDARLDPRAELGSFDITRIQGFVASSDGARQIDFGALGKDSISHGADGRTGSIAFDLGSMTSASLRYDEGSGGETHHDLSLIGTFESEEFRFEAMLTGTDGSLSGPGILGGEQQVCCFDGRFEDMAVSQADSACSPVGDYTTTPLLDEELAALEAGHDSLTRLYIAVESAAVAMGALAQASAKHVAHTPPDCDTLPEPKTDDCLTVPIELWSNPSYDPTFSAIYDELFCSRGCAAGMCHRDGDGGLLFRSKQEAYCALVNVPPSALCENDFIARVVPGDPEGSLLMAKFGFDPPCGAPMPIGSRESNDLITDAHRAQVTTWIATGAEYNPVLTDSAPSP